MTDRSFVMIMVLGILVTWGDLSFAVTEKDFDHGSETVIEVTDNALEEPATPTEEIPEEDASGGVEIEVGNKLNIFVFREPDLSKTYFVDESGWIAYPLIGKINVLGKNTFGLRSEIIEELKSFIINPQVNVSVEYENDLTVLNSVTVLGQVNRPGVYEMMRGMSLLRAVARAGGFSPIADTGKVRVIHAKTGEGESKVTLHNAEAILSGRGDDPAINPGDKIFVPESFF